MLLSNANFIPPSVPSKVLCTSNPRRSSKRWGVAWSCPKRGVTRRICRHEDQSGWIKRGVKQTNQAAWPFLCIPRIVLRTIQINMYICTKFIRKNIPSNSTYIRTYNRLPEPLPIIGDLLDLRAHRVQESKDNIYACCHTSRREEP